MVLRIDFFECHVELVETHLQLNVLRQAQNEI